MDVLEYLFVIMKTLIIKSVIILPCHLLISPFLGHLYSTVQNCTDFTMYSVHSVALSITGGRLIINMLFLIIETKTIVTSFQNIKFVWSLTLAYHNNLPLSAIYKPSSNPGLQREKDLEEWITWLWLDTEFTLTRYWADTDYIMTRDWITWSGRMNNTIARWRVDTGQILTKCLTNTNQILTICLTDTDQILTIYWSNTNQLILTDYIWNKQ